MEPLVSLEAVRAILIIGLIAEDLLAASLRVGALNLLGLGVVTPGLGVLAVTILEHLEVLPGTEVGLEGSL